MRQNYALTRNPEVAAEAMEAGEEEFAYSDDELAQIVAQEIRRSQTDFNSSVSTQREQSFRYYYGQPFGNERAGFSRHVSMDVFEGVEDVKAKLMDIFTSGHQVLRFEQEMTADEDGAKDATDYVHGIFYQQNKGYSIIEDTLHDALVSKLATVELCWYERVRVQPEIFNDVPADQINVLLSDPSVVDFKITGERQEQTQVPGPDGQPIPQMVHLISGEITRQDTVGQVKCNVIAPENVHITTVATDPTEADSIVISYPRKTKGELVAEGIDREIVEKLKFSGREFDNSRQARHAPDETYDWDGRTGEAERDNVDVHVCYIELDMDGDYIPETWKLTVAGDQLLDKERIAKKPLYFWTPYRIAHKAIGLSAADVLNDIQRTNSGLIRGVMDNIYLTNTSMKIADLSLIRNPRDLIDNPIGAVINSSDPDAVKMVPQPQLNPATFDAIALMTQQKAGRLGLTKLPAQQVISHQNSEDMINTLVAEGEERVAKMARSYAETFLKPLFIDIYNMGVEYGQVVGVETNRGYRVLDPRSLQQTRHNMRVTVALTPEERSKRAQALSTTYQMIGQDQGMAPLFGVAEKYAVLVDFFEALGTGSPAYLMNPNTEKGKKAIQQAAQQAQQAQEMQMQMQGQAAQAQMGLAMARIEKLQAEVQKLAFEMQSQGDKSTFEALQAGEEMGLEREKFAFHKDISLKELELEKKQARNVSVTGAPI